MFGNFIGASLSINNYRFPKIIVINTAIVKLNFFAVAWEALGNDKVATGDAILLQ